MITIDGGSATIGHRNKRMRPEESMSDWVRQVTIIVCAVAALSWVSAASADEVMIGGLAYTDVTIQEVHEGKLYYVTGAGFETSKSLEEIEEIKIAGIPQIEEASTLALNEEYGKAVAKLKSIRRPAAWVRDWVNHRIVEYATKANDAESAMDAYVELVRDDAPLFYFKTSPAAAVAQAKESVRTRIGETAKSSLKGVKEDHPAHAVLSELALVAMDEGAAKEAIERATRLADPGNLPLPSRINRKDDLAKLIAAEDYAAAVELGKQRLKSPGGTAAELYMLGIAQLMLAEAANGTDAAQDLYLDAGLTFMRVVVHFPSPSLGYAGAATMEVGYVHDMVNEKDKAAKLYRDAELLIDEERDRHLLARLEHYRNGGRANEKVEPLPDPEDIPEEEASEKE